MYNEIFIICIIFICFFCVNIVCQKIHMPSDSLPLNVKDFVATNGLMHFTTEENARKIMKNGLVPNDENALWKNEKGIVWTYSNDNTKYQKYINLIHKKGKRNTYDCFIVFQNISNEQLDNMHYRKKDGAIVYKGILRTEKMELHKLNDI